MPTAGEPVDFDVSHHQPRYRTSVPAIEIGHVDQPSTNNPLGITGAGEGGVLGSLPTFIVAVEDALSPFGVKLHDLPVRSPELALSMRPEVWR